MSLEVMKQALEALEQVKPLYTKLHAIAALRQAIEQAEKKEPVAWQVHPFDYGIGHEGVYARTDRHEQVEMWKRKGWTVQPLYTTPQPQQEQGASLKKLQVTLEDRPIDIELAQYKRMFEAACSALGEVSDALGCDPEEGGAEPLIAAIERLKSSSQEPVAWMVYTLDGKSVCVTDNPTDFTDEHRALPLYTTPQPQREWVGLTDEEIWASDEIMEANSGYGANFETLRKLTKAIEAKLKEKNT